MYFLLKLLLFSQSTSSFSESRAPLHQPHRPVKGDIEFSEDEEGDFEEEEEEEDDDDDEEEDEEVEEEEEEWEEEEEEEEEEVEVKRGKVQSSVWWFVENVVRRSLCLCLRYCIWGLLLKY